MKNVFIAAAFMLLVACHAKTELTKNEALQLIEKDFQKRGPASLTIVSTDEEQVGMLGRSTLFDQGYIKYVADPMAYQPLFELTERAKPYLLDPASDQSKNAFRVKLADMKVKNVLAVKLTEDGSQAVARYVYTWENPTPFFELQVNKEDQTTVAYFSLEESGWKLSEKPSVQQRSLSF